MIPAAFASLSAALVESDRQRAERLRRLAVASWWAYGNATDTARFTETARPLATLAILPTGAGAGPTIRRVTTYVEAPQVQPPPGGTTL